MLRLLAPFKFTMKLIGILMNRLDKFWSGPGIFRKYGVGKDLRLKVFLPKLLTSG
jgi:hypothetical protein